MSIPERPAQLLLLQDSLIKLKDYEVCSKSVLWHCRLQHVKMYCTVYWRVLHIPFPSWGVAWAHRSCSGWYYVAYAHCTVVQFSPWLAKNVCRSKKYATPWGEACCAILLKLSDLRGSMLCSAHIPLERFMVIFSLWLLQQCLTCSEVALNEAVSQMSPCDAWSTALYRLFGCIDR